MWVFSGILFILNYRRSLWVRELTAFFGNERNVERLHKKYTDDTSDYIHWNGIFMQMKFMSHILSMRTEQSMFASTLPPPSPEQVEWERKCWQNMCVIRLWLRYNSHVLEQLIIRLSVENVMFTSLRKWFWFRWFGQICTFCGRRDMWNEMQLFALVSFPVFLLLLLQKIGIFNYGYFVKLKCRHTHTETHTRPLHTNGC